MNSKIKSSKSEILIKDPVKEWKVHTPNLLKEVLTNKECGILLRPLQALANLLLQVSNRASQLNDNELNALMCQLTLYEISDPLSKEYDPALLNKVIKKKYLKS